MDNEELVAKRTIAETFTAYCLGQLVSLGKADLEQVKDKIWYIKFDIERLQRNRFAGAATLDNLNCPVMYLATNLTMEGLMFIVAHESVHLMQILKGDLIPGYGYSTWKGQRFKSLPAEHPEYITAQPWEKEAEEIEKILFEYLKSKFSIPSL